MERRWRDTVTVVMVVCIVHSGGGGFDGGDRSDGGRRGRWGWLMAEVTVMMVGVVEVTVIVVVDEDAGDGGCYGLDVCIPPQV